jgi:glucose/mannose-6-phosphate isomerase
MDFGKRKETTMTELDDRTTLQRLDPLDMLGHVARLPEQCRDAWDRVRDLALPPAHHNINRVVVAGMGGSAIGGDLAAAAVADRGRVPVLVHRDYDLPAYADGQTLVIALSFSGNTEETLSAFEAAHRQGCPLVAVTSGGTLAERAREWRVPLVPVEYRSQPRAALGHLLISMLGILQSAGLVADLASDLHEALAVLEAKAVGLAPESPHSKNLAKQLAVELAGRVPVVVGAGPLAPVARRWKTQINENSKGWAHFEALPELDHNALAGIHFPAEVIHRLCVLFLGSAHPLSGTLSGLHPRNRRRLVLTRQLFESHGIACHEVPVAGESPLAQILSGVQVGDYVSCYLAFHYGVDPTELEDITRFKQQMAPD